MKSNKIILLICLFVILALVVISVIFIFNTNNVNKLLENEENQIKALTGIYQDFINGFNTENINIVLDSSALKNILTNKEFKEENIISLKNIEKSYENSQVTYTISTQYTSSTKILTVKIVRTGYEHNMSVIQKYKLDSKNGEIIFERNGNETTVEE